MKFVVLAAGKGTRFLPLTQTIPKALVPILGTPLIDHVLQPFLGKVSHIIFVINAELGSKICEYAGSSYHGVPVQYVIQSELNGTFGATLLAAPYIEKGEVFCVCNSDDLFDPKEIETILDSREIGIGISQAQMPFQYLGIDRKDGMVTGFRRHEQCETLVEDWFSNGFHILSSDIFSFQPEVTKNGELGLPQTLFANLEKYPLRAFECASWQAVNGPDNILAAEDFIKKFR